VASLGTGAEAKSKTSTAAVIEFDELPVHLDMFPEPALVFDCDKADRGKPHMPTDYVGDIYKYYNDMEVL